MHLPLARMAGEGTTVCGHRRWGEGGHAAGGAPLASVAQAWPLERDDNRANQQPVQLFDVFRPHGAGHLLERERFHQLAIASPL